MAEVAVRKTLSRSSAIAKEGVRTGEDFANLMSALMSDVIEGNISPIVANAAVNAGGKLLKIVQMQMAYAYSTAKEQPGTPRSHGSIDSTPWARGALDLREVRQRVPNGYCLHLSGESAAGPWRVSLTRGGEPVEDLQRQPDLSSAIDYVLEGRVAVGPLVAKLRRVP